MKYFIILLFSDVISVTSALDANCSNIVCTTEEFSFRKRFISLNNSECTPSHFYCAGGGNCNLTDGNGRPNSNICWFESDFEESAETLTEYNLNCVSIKEDILRTTVYQLNFNCDEQLEPQSVCDIQCSTKQNFKRSQLWMCFVVMGLVLVGFVICLFRSSHKSLKRLHEDSNQYGQIKNIQYSQGNSKVRSIKPGSSTALEPMIGPSSSPGEFDRLNPMIRQEYPSSPIKQSIPHCRFDSRFEARFERPEVRIQTSDHISDEETPILSSSNGSFE